MATAGEGGAPTNTAATKSSYEGGGGEGVGGKSRKRPFRRVHHTTPYDRPLTALRGIATTATSNNNSSWLNKLVVDPVSKLISYGAHRFFASVFRKRLPPPPQPPEANSELSDMLQDAIPYNQSGTKDHAGGNGSHPVSRSDIGGILELEQLLKQKTFTRSEIERLTELLRSRAEEVPIVGNKTEEALPELASNLGRHQQFSSHPLEEDRNERNRFHGGITATVNSRIPGDDVASPTELAKVYMGSGPSKISLSMLGMRSQIGREDARLLSNAPFTPKSPVMSLTSRAAVNVGVPENGFITPRARGRSAIYNMARTPYSRFHSTATLKGSGSTNNGPSLSTSQSLLEHDVSKQVSFKRKGLILDDDLGAGSPERRIRQKTNLLSPRIPHSAGGVGIGFDGVRGPWKQKLPLVDQPKYKDSINVEKNEDDGIPSTSYARVPSKSTEVASRILQHLEKLSQREKSSEPKIVALREKTPTKLTPNMLHGQALRSLEDMESSKLLQNVHDGHKLEDWPIVTSSDTHNFTSQTKGVVDSTGPKDFAIRHDMSTPAMHNDTAGSSKTSGPSIEAIDSVVKKIAGQPLQRKHAFRMSAQEDSFELDDDILCNGVEPRPFAEGRITTETSSSKPTEEPKLDQTTPLSEEKSVPDPISSKRIDVVSDGISKREPSTRSAFSVSQATSSVSESAVLSQLVSAADKPKEANDLHPLFSFSSKTHNEVPSAAFSSLSSEPSSKKLFTWSESKPENSSSMVTVASAAIGAQLVTFGSDKGGHPNPPISGDTNGKFETALFVTSNGPDFSTFTAFSSTAASTSDTNQISTGSSSHFTSSTSIGDFDTSGSTTSTSTSGASSSSVFGSTVEPSFSAVHAFTFGSSVNSSSTAVSLASATTISESRDLKTKAEKGGDFGGSSNSSMMAASSGSSTFQLGSSVTSTANNLSQGSLFSSGSKSLVSGNVTQSMPITFGSSLTSSSITNSTSFSSSSANSEVPVSNINFGFSSAASSSETNAVFPGSGPTVSVFKFSVSSAASSDVGSLSSSSSATPGIFSFGLSSSTSSANLVGSTTGATPSVFSFGSSSTASAPGINGASASSDVGSLSSSSGATPGIFSFSLSSSTSSANLVGSTTGANPSVFSFGSSSAASVPGINGAISFSGGTSGIFSFGANSSASSSSTNLVSSSNPNTNLFGSSWQSPKSPILGSTFTSPSPSTGFAFGASSSSFTATNTAPMLFNSSTGASSNPIFSFTTALSSPSLSNTQHTFGNLPAFAASPGNDQMNAEDSMAEDTIQSSAPSVPVFGQPTVSPSPSGFMFGSTVPTQPNPFQFAGQQNQVAPPNPSPFQASASLEFNAGGSFSLGSGGGDKSGRKYVKANRNKNRKK